MDSPTTGSPRAPGRWVAHVRLRGRGSHLRVSAWAPHRDTYGRDFSRPVDASDPTARYRSLDEEVRSIARVHVEQAASHLTRQQRHHGA